MVDTTRNQGQDDINLRNLSSLSFDDYCKFMQEYEANNEPISELVFQHDKDAVTYKEAYYAIKNTIKELQSVNQFSLNYAIDIIGLLGGMLVDKGIFTEEDMEYFSKSCIKLYDETLKEATNEENNA